MKNQIINQFTKSIVVEKQRKNKVTSKDITCTLITAAVDLAFVNESCQSTGRISKSQVIYRKLENKSCDDVQECFQEINIKFLKMMSRNRKFIVSFDTTKEAFYGEFSKAEDKKYLHAGSIANESKFYYEYLTSAITSNNSSRYIIDAIIIPRRYYVEDYVEKMLIFVKEILPIEVALFDRGFGSWGMIYMLKKLGIPFIIFWKKQGNWYKEHLENMQEGEFKRILREEKYCRNKTTYKTTCNFIIIKQLEYNNKKYDWIFATNISQHNAESYVILYKKRWGIETIYRVTDDIRIFTTSTKAVIRCFLFAFTCLVYNVWKFFQTFMGEKFTLANFKTHTIKYFIETKMINPKNHLQFEKIAEKIF